MTKNNDGKPKSATAKKLEEFPSPPKKDGTADPENIMAKKEREKAEAELKRAWDAHKKSGGKKPKGGSSSGAGKKG